MAGRSAWAWVAAAAIAIGLVAATRGGHHTSATPSATATVRATTAPSTAAPTPTGTPDFNNPALYATAVARYAAEAGIHPQLLMAILYNESYKPHDPAFEREWQRVKPGASLGIANMHKAAFDETRQGRPFAGRTWQDLPGNPDLAIEAAAWYLHDLSHQLPAHRTGRYSPDELLALGYNTGAGNMRAFARGATAGQQARLYLSTLHDNWPRAAAALKR